MQGRPLRAPGDWRSAWVIPRFSWRDRGWNEGRSDCCGCRSLRHAARGTRHQGVASAFFCRAPSRPPGVASSSVELWRRRAHVSAALLRRVRQSRVDPGRSPWCHPGGGDARGQHRRGGPPIRTAGRRSRRSHLGRSGERRVARRGGDRRPAGLGDKSGRHWRTDWEDGHYVVVVGLSRDRVYVMDPSVRTGYGYLTRDQFLQRWHDYDLNRGKRVTFERLGIVIRGSTPLARYPAEPTPVE